MHAFGDAAEDLGRGLVLWEEVNITLGLVEKWALLIVATLDQGTLRFTDLHAQITGISQRMLTLTLKGLERAGRVDVREDLGRGLCGVYPFDVAETSAGGTAVGTVTVGNGPSRGLSGRRSGWRRARSSVQDAHSTPR